MAEELAREIQEFIGDLQGTSRPPREHGSWNALARIYDVRGPTCWYQLFDIRLEPYERISDFKLDFEGLDLGYHASCTREVGMIIGAYDLNVVALNPIKAVATEDTVLWNIPSFNPEESWAVAHIVLRRVLRMVSSSCLHEPQPTSGVHLIASSHCGRQKDSLHVECFVWPRSTVHLGPDFTPPPEGHFGISGSVHGIVMDFQHYLYPIPTMPCMVERWEVFWFTCS